MGEGYLAIPSSNDSFEKNPTLCIIYEILRIFSSKNIKVLVMESSNMQLWPTKLTVWNAEASVYLLTYYEASKDWPTTLMQFIVFGWKTIQIPSKEELND